MDSNKSSAALLLRLELIWWIFTVLIVVGVLFPIKNYLVEYPFLYSNILYIIVFITFTRYIFLLPFTFLAHRQTLKIILVFLCIPLVFLLVQELNHFQTYLDYNGAEALLGRSDSPTSNAMTSYIYNQMLLFAVGSIISSVAFPFRLILSVWRVRNRGTI